MRSYLDPEPIRTIYSFRSSRTSLPSKSAAAHTPIEQDAKNCPSEAGPKEIPAVHSFDNGRVIVQIT